MAVHVPLSPTAIIEAETLMLSSRNILSPAHGHPITVPTQDIVLGTYYLTLSRPNLKGEGKVFATSTEVIAAYNEGHLETHARIRLRYSGDLIDLKKHGNSQRIDASMIEPFTGIINTTVGRVVFNHAFPDYMPYINGILKKGGLTSLVYFWNNEYGREKTVVMLDILKNLGFNYATRAGVSFGIDDMVIPPSKGDLLRGAKDKVIEVEGQYKDGLLTNAERYNKVVQVWSEVTEDIAADMFEFMEGEDVMKNNLNPIFVMADSGARGSKQQIRQLAGMRGLMAKPSGEIHETPITANFKEGLTVLQYFISTHGARKGLADTALKTADSGYLTRRLVDVAQDVIISEEDCGTLDGITAHAIIEQGEIIESLKDRIVGRVALDDVYGPNDELICEANDMISNKLANKIQDSGIHEVENPLRAHLRIGSCVCVVSATVKTLPPVSWWKSVKPLVLSQLNQSVSLALS